MKGILKVWWPIAAWLGLLVIGLAVQFRTVWFCLAEGGTWIGGMTRAAFCEPASKSEVGR